MRSSSAAARSPAPSSNLIEAQLTARAGDYFTLKIEGRSSTRETKITIANGETLRSLALKINGALLFDGKATAMPVKGGQALKLAVNDGVKVELVAGPKDFDALAGLGISPQTLVGDQKKDDNSSKDDEPPFETIGLDLDGKLSLSDEERCRARPCRDECRDVADQAGLRQDQRTARPDPERRPHRPSARLSASATRQLPIRAGVVRLVACQASASATDDTFAPGFTADLSNEAKVSAPSQLPA